ncbi:Coiled-coil-helix-coiled-coil-helix domain-containing protein 6 [Cricetulus griseus]|uniref:Coiled-coil-helix-coiled-coil-helix domain-containing protein 6 n=1 Tax=Cricetulus griseus TaxID=10029 RepID=G3GRZ5_CRIGR|nr:Coiled-coil-helix-coiled-coil-helix domain-containing protein 6 [Cricetulus griseus]
MGSAESAEARRVSFEMDEEERVRVLQGIRLSESVVNRMKDSSQPSAGPCPVPTVPAPTTPAPTSPPSTTSVPSMPVPIAPPPSSSDPSEGAFKAPPTDSKVPRAESGGGQQPSAVKEDLKRFQQEQAVVQDELAKVAKREKEAVEKHLKASLPKKRASPTREQQKSALLARELEKREAELNRRDTFYKEQQGRIQEKHATAKPGRSVGSGFPGNGDKRAVAPCFTATCLPTSASLHHTTTFVTTYIPATSFPVPFPLQHCFCCVTYSGLFAI